MGLAKAEKALNGQENQSRLRLDVISGLAFEGVAAPVVASEGLGVGHQLPALGSELIHQLDQTHALRMIPGDQRLVIQPELLNFSSPAFATGNKAKLCVFPGHQRSMSQMTLRP